MQRTKKKRTISIVILILGMLCAGCRKETAPLEEAVLSEKTDMEEAQPDEEKKTDAAGNPETAKDSGEASGETDRIWVYVTGAVHNPGVYPFPETARIYEAVERAGGMTDEADREFLNLAQVMADGMQIRVPTQEETAGMTPAQAGADGGNAAQTVSGGGGASQTSGSGVQKINLNTASREELLTLPGIGEAKAAAVVAYREANGGFSSIEDIKNVEGIKEGVFQKIKELITV